MLPLDPKWALGSLAKRGSRLFWCFLTGLWVLFLSNRISVFFFQTLSMRHRVNVLSERAFHSSRCWFNGRKVLSILHKAHLSRFEASSQICKRRRGESVLRSMKNLYHVRPSVFAVHTNISVLYFSLQFCEGWDMKMLRIFGLWLTACVVWSQSGGLQYNFIKKKDTGAYSNSYVRFIYDR